jgi:D-cysteine desulfhydrase family pyridoxal phosphate-dependent enzyme
MPASAKFPLATTPSPLLDAPRLSAALGGPKILIKRDDLTGRVLGGNKIRKLEYLLGDALAQGATHVVTGGGAQSNHACLTAVCARMAGLQPVVVLSRPATDAVTGNLLIYRLLGLEPLFIDSYDPAALEAEMDAVCQRLGRQGHRPYFIPLGGSTAVGILGYRDCLLEIVQQCSTRNVQPQAIYTAVGTGGTLAGLVFGLSGSHVRIEVAGIDVGAIPGGPLPRIQHLLDQCGVAPASALFSLDQGHIGPGYAQPGPHCLAAIRLFLSTEGLLLDPVYTGKSAAGLIAHVQEGRLRPEDTVIFLHTGGAAGLFAIPALAEQVPN